MEDHYVVLLERIVSENRRLREAIEARDNEQQRVLQELSTKFDSTVTPARTTARKRKRKITVSQQCRVSTVFHSWYFENNCGQRPLLLKCL